MRCSTLEPSIKGHEDAIELTRQGDILRVVRLGPAVLFAQLEGRDGEAAWLGVVNLQRDELLNGVSGNAGCDLGSDVLLADGRERGESPCEGPSG